MYAHQIVRNKLFKISCSDRTGIHGAVVHGLGIRQHNDHLFSALCKSAFDGLRYLDFVGPLFGADEITMQRIYYGIASRFLLGVAGR